MKVVRLLLQSILLSIQFKTAKSEMPVTCEAGHFNISDTASVTCHFSENVKNSNHHVYITLYPFNSSKSEDILRCAWTSQTSPQCKVKEGVRFDGNISEQLKVEIPDVTKDFAGSFVCQLVTPEEQPLRMCNLTVQETSNGPEQRQSSEKLQEPNKYLHVAVAVVLSVIAVVVVIVIIVIAKKRSFHSCLSRKDVPKGDPLLHASSQSASKQGNDGNPAPGESCLSRKDLQKSDSLLYASSQSASKQGNDGNPAPGESGDTDVTRNDMRRSSSLENFYTARESLIRAPLQTHKTIFEVFPDQQKSEGIDGWRRFAPSNDRQLGRLKLQVTKIDEAVELD